jgi:glycosyltransferase involved in cell wall biosynthesis
MTTENRHPGVSIIVPVYNDEKYISQLMESLLKQDYPKDRYEIIIVDNGSKDTTVEKIKCYPVTLLQEKDVQSSYAARNKGLQHSKYSVFAFIDSDCIASSQWLKEGVRFLLESKADLVGGRVEFYFSSHKTAAEYYDSLIHFKFDETIRKRRVTGAGNLFVHSYVFKKIGLFPNVQSGGDFQWTGQAVKEGFHLLHCPSAIVKHPARKLSFLLQKHKRTGSGKPFIWKTTEGRMFKPSLLLSLFPPNIFGVKNMIKERGSKEMQRKLILIWAVKYLCKLYFFAGALKSILFILSHPGQSKSFTMEVNK